MVRAGRGINVSDFRSVGAPAILRGATTGSSAHPNGDDETMSTTKHATAVWEGKLRDGKGSFTGESGTINGAYTFATRFENQKGTSPEELLAAAEAACFSMALSVGLDQNGTPPTKIETNAACTVAPATGGGFGITTIALTVRVTAPGLDTAALQPIAEATKKNCPVSKALANNVEITLDAQVVG